MNKNAPPTDDQVLSELVRLGRGSGVPTYYVKNSLQMSLKIGAIKTEFVRRALVRLEKAGKVVRVSSTTHVFMLHWVPV